MARERSKFTVKSGLTTVKNHSVFWLTMPCVGKILAETLPKLTLPKFNC